MTQMSFLRSPSIVYSHGCARIVVQICLFSRFQYFIMVNSRIPNPNPEHMKVNECEAEK